MPLEFRNDQVCLPICVAPYSSFHPLDRVLKVRPPFIETPQTRDMPDTVELSIDKVLKGQPLAGPEAEILDFSLEEQNAALESQGIKPSVDPGYKPIVRETVTYIVAVVLVNDNDEILMMQESKESCYGKWYLPAGRIEECENIYEAATREVLEETGMHVELTTLLLVECAGGSWIRFVLTGNVTGGTLKTEEDKESIQARWVDNLDSIELRARDMTHLVEKARLYKQGKLKGDKSWYPDQLPALRSHSKILMRLVVAIKKKATNRIHVLISERTSWHLPTCEVHPGKSAHSTLRRFMVDLFGAEVAPHRPHGILSVEHDARNKEDGVCLTLLVAFRAPLEEVPIIGKCVWHEISQDLGNTLSARLSSRHGTIEFHVIR